jgi:hypothetical protein
MRGVSIEEVNMEAGLVQMKPRPMKSYDEREAFGYGQTRIGSLQLVSAAPSIPAQA